MSFMYEWKGGYYEGGGGNEKIILNIMVHWCNRLLFANTFNTCNLKRVLQ